MKIVAREIGDFQSKTFRADLSALDGIPTRTKEAYQLIDFEGKTLGI